MSKMIEVSIEVVPTSGKPTTKKVRIEARVRLSDVLAKVGISGKDRDFTINGEPATPETLVGDGTKVKAVQHVRVEERPAGS